MPKMSEVFFKDMELVASSEDVRPQRVYVYTVDFDYANRKSIRLLGIIESPETTFTRYADVIKRNGLNPTESAIFITVGSYFAGQDWGVLEAFLEVLPNGTYRRWDMDGNLLI